MPQGTIFEADQKIQPAAFAAGLTFCLERADSNDKQSFVGVRIFHSVAMRPACILVVVQTSHCSFSHTRIRTDQKTCPAAKVAGCCINVGLTVFSFVLSWIHKVKRCYAMEMNMGTFYKLL